jgi:serine/threonine-protein kinase RsbW
MPDAGWLWSLDERIKNEAADGRDVTERILAAMQHEGWADHDRFAVHLAMEEALVNAMKHGNLRDPCKCVDVSCRLSAERVQIRIADQGNGFDPASVPDPTDDDNLEIPSGRGLMLMRCYMTTIRFNERGNEVWMEKVRDADGEAAEDDELDPDADDSDAASADA